MISALGPTGGINSNDTYLRINGAIATFQVVFSPNEIFSKPAGNDLSSDTFVRTAGFHRLSRRTVEAKMRLVDLEFFDENGNGAIGATASASAKRELKLRNIGGNVVNGVKSRPSEDRRQAHHAQLLHGAVERANRTNIAIRLRF